MKEQIHTIPINDALDNAGECLFCYIERRTEEHCMNFVLGHGASYMEADIRDMTDRAGFCRTHFKKMFDYGNALGNAWILKTHYRRVIDEMKKEFKNFKPGKPAKKGLFAKPSDSDSTNAIVSWIKEKAAAQFAGHILTFAWNEFEEGGIICPVMNEQCETDISRLKAFRKVSDYFKNNLKTL